jgi:hypothetical protein
MSYINPSPGVAGREVTLTLSVNGLTADAGMSVPALQDVTVNNSNDIFTWTQLDEGSKLNVATTATNSLDMNIVLDETTFFGNAGATANSAAFLGIFGLSKNKSLVDFDLFIGEGRTISGSGYVTGLAPTVSADAPVWVSPITITVTGDYTISGT